MIDAIFNLILNFLLTIIGLGLDLVIWLIELIAIIWIAYWICKVSGINAYISDFYRGLKHVFRTKDW